MINTYRVDVRKTNGNKLVARGVELRCDMWDVNEAVLVLKLLVASSEMQDEGNKDKLAYRRPQRDYTATVTKITRHVVVTERRQILTTRA